MKKRILIIFFLLASVISFIWFREGKLFAAAEEGMPFYKPSRAAEVYSSVLYDNGTGFIDPLLLPRYPIYRISQIFTAFLPNYIVQQIVFTLLIVTATYGTYLLSKKLNFSENASFISGIFYLLNLFVMTQVWRRAVYSGFFIWAYLPLFLLFWIRWLEEKKYRHLFILISSSILFSYIYTQPAFLLVIWFPASFYTLFGVIRKKKYFISRSLLALVLWIIINIWWIYPFLTISNSSLEKSIAVDKSLESLQGVSVSFPVSEIVLLKQKGYFDSSYNPQIPQLSWGTWYEGVFPKMLSYAVFIITLFGWWKLRKAKNWVYLSAIALAGLLISKGTNPPLGYVFYKQLFYNFPIFQVFRNSYEKFGLVWLLPYALFFGAGITLFYEKIRKIFFSPVILGIVLTLFFIVLVWPIWSGKLFENYYWIRVPDYYQDANQFLRKDREDFRILILPMLPSHGVALKWGYRGDEPSISLFNKTAISKNINYPFYTKKYAELTEKFNKKIVDDKLLNDFNVKYVVLHNDVNWALVGADSVDKMQDLLRQNDSLESVGIFGSLEIFRLKNFDSSIISLYGDNLPNYEYLKNSNNSYNVKISNSTNPFIIVLKNTYSDLWQAKINGEVIKSHTVIYDYANGWSIDEKGDYEIKISLRVWPWD